MRDETEYQRLEEKFIGAWNYAEWVYDNVASYANTSQEGEAFLRLIWEIRALGYDRYFDCDCQGKYFEIWRGNIWIDILYGQAVPMELTLHIADKSIEVKVDRFALTSELKTLLDLLMFQPLETESL